MSAAATRVLAGLLEARTGQVVSPARTWRIETALKPLLRELGMTSLDPLVARITQGHDALLATKAVEALLNNESSFFRDFGVFDLLNREALERLRIARAATRRLRIWSAGCSTGQEAYTLAILFADAAQRWQGWTIEIVGTDISAAAVARAKAGRFSQFEIQRGLPARTMLRWFTQVDEDWLADPALRRIIRFGIHNIVEAPPGRFDVVLCRNVLMYFPVAARRAIFDRLSTAIEPDGTLMLGAGETVIGQTEAFAADPVLRGLYTPVNKASRDLRFAAARMRG